MDGEREGKKRKKTKKSRHKEYQYCTVLIAVGLCPSCSFSSDICCWIERIQPPLSSFFSVVLSQWNINNPISDGKKSSPYNDIPLRLSRMIAWIYRLSVVNMRIF
jgi:hypothetical protein